MPTRQHSRGGGLTEIKGQMPGGDRQRTFFSKEFGQCPSPSRIIPHLLCYFVFATHACPEVASYNSMQAPSQQEEPDVEG